MLIYFSSFQVKPLSRYIMPIVQQRFSRLMIPDYPISSVTYRSYVWNIISKSKTSFFFSQGLSKIQFCSMRALKALYSVQYMSGFSPHIKDQIKENGSTFNLFFVGEGIPCAVAHWHTYKLYKVNCAKSSLYWWERLRDSILIKYLQQNFWKWVWPPLPFEQC